MVCGLVGVLVFVCVEIGDVEFLVFGWIVDVCL